VIISGEKSIAHLEKNTYVAGVVYCGTGARFSAPPVFLKAINVLL